MIYVHLIMSVIIVSEGTNRWCYFYTNLVTFGDWLPTWGCWQVSIIRVVTD
jgi:hypothetical protein